MKYLPQHGVFFLKRAVSAALVSLSCACMVQASEVKAEPGVRLQDLQVVVPAGPQTAFFRENLATLTDVVCKVTGCLPAVSVEGAQKGAGPFLYLGNTAAARGKNLGVCLRKGDWRVTVEPGRVYLLGGTDQTTAMAVTEFAERYCDYHFVTLDGNDPYTRNPELTVPCCDRVIRPAIYARYFRHDMNRRGLHRDTWRLWARLDRVRGNYRKDILENDLRLSSRVKMCHSSFDYLPPEKFFKDHPEYYSLGKDGRRHAVANSGSQLCYSNPDVYRHVLASLERFVAADRAANPTNYPCIYDFSQGDNSDFLCLCPDCKRIIAKYNRVPGGHKEGGDAGLQLEFVNRLARDIRKKYPDVNIRVFAYVNTGCAPKPGTIGVEPNVVILWCDVYSYSDHMRALETPGHFNMKQARELDDWLKLTKNVELWDYMLYRDYFPEFSPDAIKADVKFFAERGLSNIFMETEYFHQPFYLLNFYLMSRLYVDPAEDVDALIRTFCRGYGKSEAEMYDLLRFLRETIAANPTKNASEWHLRYLPWLDRTTLETLSAMAQKAYDKDDSPHVRPRIASVLAATWHQLIKVHRAKGERGPAFTEAQEKYRRFAKETILEGIWDRNDRDKAAAAVDEAIDLMTLRFDDLPAEIASVPADELLCFDYHGAWRAEYAEDPDSTRGFAIVTQKMERHVKPEVPCGSYDWNTKLGFKFTIKPDPAYPEKYRWVKLGRMHIGRNTKFWLHGSWKSGRDLFHWHILADGAAEDPNWYEMWISVKFEGPVYHPGSKKKNRVLVDRFALRRIAPPKN